MAGHERPLKLSKLDFRGRVAQARARLLLLTARLITFPAHFWPVNQLAKLVAHGEPLAGLTPKSAARVALEIANGGGSGVIVGRLAPTMRDDRSAQGAEKSFLNLIDELAAARKKNPNLRPSVAFDPDSLGLGLAGRSPRENERIATRSMLKIARHAKEKGVAIELDSTDLATLPITHRIAEKMVREVRVPVRLALAARFEATDKVLQQWADLAERSGIKLGVRLVKGSFVENVPGTINVRKDLMEHYKKVITAALGRGRHLDVAVATQNEAIWQHADKTAARLGVDYKVHVIRGVNAPLQAKMRAKGVIGAEYISYGMDAPAFGIAEMLATVSARRSIAKDMARTLD